MVNSLPTGSLKSRNFDSKKAAIGGVTPLSQAVQIAAQRIYSFLAVAADDDGRVFATGYFEGTADFDPGQGTDLRASQGLSDIFLLALNADGTHAWSRATGDEGSDRGQALTVDRGGHVLVAGRFMNTVDFNPTKFQSWSAGPPFRYVRTSSRSKIVFRALISIS